MIRRRDDAHAFEQAWRDGAPARGEIADLVRVAEHLCERADVEPSTDFRLTLRERLMTEAETVLVSPPVAPRGAVRAPARRRTRRRLAAVTAAVATCFGAVSLVMSSATALPGEVLYPVKLGVENVQLSLKDDGAERGAYQLERATERLREAEVVAVETGEYSRLPDLLSDFTSQTEDGSSILFDSFATDGDEASIDRVNDFATRSTTVLATIAEPELPAEVDAAWDEAARTISGLALESSRLCGACDKADVDELIRSVTAAAEPQQATTSEPRSSEPTRSHAGSTAATAPPTRSAPAPSTTEPSRTASPSPSASRSGLRSVTDPVVGGLLGDDERDGLVPSLLETLLGTGKQ